MAKLLAVLAPLCVLVLMDHVNVASASNETCIIKSQCKTGIILPMWMPQENLSSGDRAARGVVYFAALLFFFLGVSIVADRFMAAIEVITSKERDVTIKKPNGETIMVTVRVWNETVSNLTLMALGSSAPEIMLSVIEVCGKKFEAGDLGPGTIVGSAAFNLFMIMAICVYVIPDGEVRRVKHLRVFFVTATWSIFAYLWLYLIIAQITPGRVDVAEGVITFLFFPVTVLTAYVADRRLFPTVFLSKRYRRGIHKGVMVQSEGPGDLEMGAKNHIGEEDGEKEPDELQEFEQHRHEFIEILRELRKKHPDADMKHLEEMAEMEVMNRGPKSRAYYRIQATRKLTGGGNVIKKSKLEKLSSLEDIKLEDDGITRIYFEPGHHTVMENVGSFQATVARHGGNLNNTVYVDYKTEDGTANAGSDYDFAEGTLVFGPGETEKSFALTIIDDDVFEEDEHFYVKLSNIRVGGLDGMFMSTDHDRVKLGTPSTLTVMILDDDHAGIYHFEEPEVKVVESIGEAHVKVVRSSGARGCVAVPYRTMDGTSKGCGVDFQDAVGELIFENDETVKYIAVGIIDDEEYEKDEYFFIELGEPKLLRKGSKPLPHGFFNRSLCEDSESLYDNHNYLPLDAEGRYEELPRVDKPLEEMTDDERIAELGRPRLGEILKTTVHITESLEFKNTVDKMLSKAHISMVVGTSSWREQFIEAITVSAGDDDGGEDEEGEERLPSCTDYIMHFLTIFWKVLFAIVPPTEYWGGWACFTVSIILIGVLTAFIQDIASSFGCTVGLQDSVTAISFVALGTSVPDTFASKVAAIGDKYADSSIGNVTGSNAVNVFLGIGIAWTVASIYHAANGTEFKVEAGSLGFSLTLFCAFAFLCIATLLIRRRPFVGGELGGPAKYKYPTSIFFCTLWITYVIVSALVSYCHIKGF